MIILLCILASVIASILVVSACILSARISRAENLVEQYEDDIENAPQPQVARRPYSL
jgi:hypothetical protein